MSEQKPKKSAEPLHRRRRRDGRKVKGGFGHGRRVPDRWLQYGALGRSIEGTRFVPFKTPLDKSFSSGKDGVPQSLCFDVDRVVESIQQAGKSLGMVVDLTNTDRYYKKEDWETYNIKYVKLNCPGHEISKRDDLVKKFFNVVDEFISDQSTGDRIIGVHCTHGVNRTGYLICRYLIEKLGWTATQAISAAWLVPQDVLDDNGVSEASPSHQDLISIEGSTLDGVHHWSRNKGRDECKVDSRHMVPEVEQSFHEKHCNDSYFRRINSDLSKVMAACVSRTSSPKQPTPQSNRKPRAPSEETDSSSESDSDSSSCLSFSTSSSVSDISLALRYRIGNTLDV